MGSVSRLSLCVHIVGSRWKLRQRFVDSYLRCAFSPRWFVACGAPCARPALQVHVGSHSRPHRLHKFSLESRRQIPRALHIL
ncbi:hypothetical protein PI124_g5228 [Phytophthora idaei]|nr:hypothetical protein PI125_g5955 [Phytophthora idaei]KAG3250124.1 hypothetical protein PI124_g5228 [Phytophthora idaei]